MPNNEQIPIEEVAPNLPDKLKAEQAGIFRWLVKGALEWLSGGHQIPPYSRGNGEYREESDSYHVFLNDVCDLGGSTDVVLARDACNAIERLGASKGSDIGGKSSGTAGISDGGALKTTRFAHLVRVARAAVNGWDYLCGETSGDAWVILNPPNLPLNVRQMIRASEVLDAIAVEGRDVSHILAAHGWPLGAEYRKALQVKALEMLDELAVAMGFGRAV